MKPISSSQMRELEREANETYGIPLLLLMENAGKKTAAHIQAKFKPKTAVIFCGKGNNGGDGFVVAEQLHAQGVHVLAVIAADPADIKEQAHTAFVEMKTRGVPFLTFPPKKDPSKVLDATFHDHAMVKKVDLIVDALVGIGVNTEITGVYKEMIEWMNSAGKPIVAVDIPSGMNPDDGSVQTVAVKAAMTVAMALPKVGFTAGRGPELCGEVKVVDIGLPAHLIKPLLSA